MAVLNDRQAVDVMRFVRVLADEAARSSAEECDPPQDAIRFYVSVEPGWKLEGLELDALVDLYESEVRRVRLELELERRVEATATTEAP